MDDEAEIREIRRMVEEAENALDAAAFAELFTNDVAMLPQDLDPIYGAANVEEFHRRLYEGFDSLDIRFSIEEIRVVGGLAVERGSYRGTSVADGVARTGGGEYLYSFERGSDGTWRIVRMSWS